MSNCPSPPPIEMRAQVPPQLTTIVSERLIDSLAVAAFVLDLHGNVILWNRACETMTSVLAAEVIGTNSHWLGFYRAQRICLADFVITGTFNKTLDLYVEAGPSPTVSNGLRAKGWFVLPRTSVKMFAVVDASPLYDDHGNMVAVLETIQDITEKKEAEIASGSGIRERRTSNQANNSGKLYVASKNETADFQFNDYLWRQTNYDALTNLPNRHLFRTHLEAKIRAAHDSGNPLALFFIDLDNFKDINEALGHSTGDALLIEAARRIAGCVREMDAVGHLGGDEFTLILSEIGTNDIEHVAARILEQIAQPFHLGTETAYVTAAIGIAQYPTDAASQEDLLKNADQAMQMAKNEGRNRFCYFIDKFQEEVHAKMRLLTDLRGALKAGQLEVHFQPIIDLKTGEITKAEALIRWNHPELGWVSPVDFIPLAEKSGLIHKIGDWVFRESARWAHRWGNKMGSVFQISVNKSPVQFTTQEDAVTWPNYLKEIGLSGSSIGIEITEGILLNAAPRVHDRLRQYRDAGLQIAIDDFGTGYSSLSYLRKFSVDFLKIDQSFVRDMSEDEGDRAIAETIIIMAHKLGLKVIAEGIETEAQRDLLCAAHCDYGQGWLFSKAVPPEQFEVMLMERRRF